MDDAVSLSRVTKAFEAGPIPGVLSAYVFGSRADGRAHRESDLDVAVLLDRAVYPSARARFEARLRLISELIGALHLNDVDLVVLDDAPPLLGRRVIHEGRRVYCADPEADRRFVRDVQLRAADLAPFLERFRAAKLAAVRR